MTTLVIGARGAVGRHVVAGLREAGEQVRAAGRTAAGVDVVADLDRPDTLGPALDGVRRVFVYAVTDGAAAFAGAAARAGVEQVVLLSSGSVLLPDTGNAFAVEHRAVEETLAAAGLRCTPVRPLVLATTALAWARPIRTERAVALVHPDAVLAPVHERDVAAVAVAALTGAGDVSGMLTAGEALSQREQVAVIGAAAGVDVRVDALTEDEGRARLRRHLSPARADAVVALLAAATAPGGSPTTTTVRDVLGRDPLTFAEWAREHAADFR